MLGQGQQLEAFNAQVFANTPGYDEYISKVQQINQQIPFWMQHIQEMTPIQYAFAQALAATGLTAAEVMAKMREQATVYKEIELALQDYGVTSTLSAEETQRFGIELAKTATISAEAAGFVQGLAQAVADGLPIEQAYIALKEFSAGATDRAAAAQAAATAATTAATTATTVFTEALTNEAIEKANDQIVSEALKVQQEALYNAALLAAQGFGNAGNAAVAMAGQFGIAIAEAQQLILALAQVQRAKDIQALGIANVPASQQNALFNVDAARQATEYRAELDKVSKAQQAYNYASANTAGKLAQVNRELAAVKVGSEKYYELLTKQDALEKQMEAEKKKGGGAPKLTPNEKINVGLLDQLDKYNAKFEEAEEEHYEKLADIIEDYNKKVEEQTKKNEVSKRRSRYDFYSNLADSEGIDTQKFAAAYEEAFAKAQEIAQSGKAKLAQEFLELRQRQIEEMKELDEEAARIQKDKKEGTISEEEAKAQLAYLEERRKMLADAQAEEQKQLLEGGDEYQKQRDEQIAAESERYAQAQDDIAQSAGRAADAKVRHAERSKIAVDAENKALAEQARYYDRIAARNGGVVPESARQQAPVNQTAPNTPEGTAAAPVNVEASAPIPVSSAEGLLIRQADVFIVRDTDVYNVISDMTTRIEGRLGEVVTAVTAAKDSITNAVVSVERAVGRLKSGAANTNSVVQL